MKEYSFLVEEKFNNRKIIDFLLCQGLSKEIVQKVKFGGVFIDGVRINNVNTLVKTSSVVKIVLPPDEANPYIAPIKKPLEIIYEDEYLLCVFKESGVLTHSSRGNDLVSLEQLVCGYMNSPFTFRAINRLDRDTSGIVLIAKDMVSACFLNKQMKAGNIMKSYYAIVEGNLPSEHFIIEKPIKRQSPLSMKRVCAEDGKHAKTEVKLIKKLPLNKTLIEATLHTGRTHQIRVHLSSIGNPLYADDLYGNKIKGKSYFLCAYKLTFNHPISNKETSLTVDISKKLPN